MEGPEIDPQKYRQLTFDKGTKAIKQMNDRHVNKQCWKIGYLYKKGNFNSYLVLCTKLNSNVSHI